MAQDMNNIGGQMVKEAISTISKSANQKDEFNHAGDAAKRIAQKEAEERARKMAQKKLEEKGLDVSKLKDLPKKAMDKVKDGVKNVAVKMQSQMNNVASEARQAAMRTAGNVAAAPTGGTSKVVAEKAAMADKQMTQQVNKAREQKAEQKSSVGDQTGKRMESQIKNSIKEKTMPGGVIDAKSLASKTMGIKPAGKDTMSIVSSKTSGVLKESLTPKIEKDNKER